MERVRPSIPRAAPRRRRMTAVAVLLLACVGSGTEAFSLGGIIPRAGALGTPARRWGSQAQQHVSPPGATIGGFGVPRRGNSVRGREGARGLSAVGGGAELKSLLRKYGLTAITFHAAQWTVWMAIGYSALSYVNIADMAEVLPGRVLEAVEVGRACNCDCHCHAGASRLFHLREPAGDKFSMA